MNNILMFCFRRTKKYSPKKVAAKLGISVDEYIEIERGLLMPTPVLMQKLGELYNVNGDYFYEAALQLEDLLSTRLVLKILKNENERMNKLLEGGYELIHASKAKEDKVET